MAMRLSGLMSGMDTESIISQLVEAKKTKVDKTKKAQTKLEWKQDAWKSLNTKLKNLQSKYLSNMRFSSAYSKKVTKVSNPNAVSVITGEDAVNGVQSLEISKLAKTGYLTGSSIEKEDGTRFTADSKLSELGMNQSGTIQVSTGGKTIDISLSGDTKISDVLTQLKNAGLNANFDAENQRFFVSARESGTKSDFSISAMDEGGKAALNAMGLQEGINQATVDILKGIDLNTITDAEIKALDLSATMKEYVKYARYYVAGDQTATINKMGSLVQKEIDSRTADYLAKYKSLKESKAAAEKAIKDIDEKYAGDAEWSANISKAYEVALTDYDAAIKVKNDAIAEKEKELKDTADLSEDDKKKLEEKIAELKKETNELSERRKDTVTWHTQTAARDNAQKEIEGVEKYVTVTETPGADGEVSYSAVATSELQSEVEKDLYNKAKTAYDEVTNANVSAGATKINGQDSVIYLNGAEFTSNSNTFKINGLTFTALNETKEGEQITVTTEQDTDGIYDMVKNFLKEYNAIVNEMDKLYNADSAKGYEPLTTEEKDALSDSEVEEYEKKIKDALLRRDDNLSSISSALKEVMSSGIEVGGKKMYLFDFGIDTLGYFEAADNERNAYHIAGDPDDANTAGNADVLKGMIANDPDTVISFFSKLSQNLYDKMSEMSKSVDGYRSFGSFYDDKKMKSDYDDYTSKIKEQEQKLNDYEDKWYKKFAAMETALAKMQSSANAVTSLLGG